MERITYTTYTTSKNKDPWAQLSGPFHYKRDLPLDFSAGGLMHHWEGNSVQHLSFYQFRAIAGDPRLEPGDWNKDRDRVMRRWGFPMWHYLIPDPSITHPDIETCPDNKIPPPVDPTMPHIEITPVVQVAAESITDAVERADHYKAEAERLEHQAQVLAQKNEELAAQLATGTIPQAAGEGFEVDAEDEEQEPEEPTPPVKRPVGRPPKGKYQ